jgi:hypothetical protein
MVTLTALWLPILLSAVVVFVASSIIQRATRWHAGRFKRFSAEEAVIDTVRPFNLAPAGGALLTGGGFASLWP